MNGGLEDFFDNDDFLIDPHEMHPDEHNEGWNTGIDPDICSTGHEQDIFNTKN